VVGRLPNNNKVCAVQCTIEKYATCTVPCDDAIIIIIDAHRDRS